jgi:hypothetical protein
LSDRIERSDLSPVRVRADEMLATGEETGAPIIRNDQLLLRFTGPIEKPVMNLKPTEAAAAPGRPD